MCISWNSVCLYCIEYSDMVVITGTILALSGLCALVTALGGYLAYKSTDKTNSTRNEGEIVNTIQLTLPKDDRNDHIILLLYIIVGIAALYVLSKIFKHWCSCRAHPRTQIINMKDLENPRSIA